MKLTREQIEAMQPGDQLDKIIAINVMGFDPSNMRDGWVRIGSLATYPKRYSTDISAAWEVVDKVQEERGASFRLNRSLDGPFPLKWIALFGGYEWETPRVVRINPAEAICKAALLAIGGEQE